MRLARPLADGISFLCRVLRGQPHRPHRSRSGLRSTLRRRGSSVAALPRPADQTGTAAAARVRVGAEGRAPPSSPSHKRSPLRVDVREALRYQAQWSSAHAHSPRKGGAASGRDRPEPSGLIPCVGVQLPVVSRRTEHAHPGAAGSGVSPVANALGRAALRRREAAGGGGRSRSGPRRFPVVSQTVCSLARRFAVLLARGSRRWLVRRTARYVARVLGAGVRSRATRRDPFAPGETLRSGRHGNGSLKRHEAASCRRARNQGAGGNSATIAPSAVGST